MNLTPEERSIALAKPTPKPSYTRTSPRSVKKERQTSSISLPAGFTTRERVPFLSRPSSQMSYASSSTASLPARNYSLERLATLFHHMLDREEPSQGFSKELEHALAYVQQGFEGIVGDIVHETEEEGNESTIIVAKHQKQVVKGAVGGKKGNISVNAKQKTAAAVNEKLEDEIELLSIQHYETATALLEQQKKLSQVGTQHGSKAADSYDDEGHVESVKHIKRSKPLDPLDLPRPPTRGKQPLPAEAQKYVRSILYEDYESYARSRDSPSRREVNPSEKDMASDVFLTTREAKANNTRESPWDANLEKVSFGKGKRGDQIEAKILTQKRREQEQQNLKRSVKAFTKMAEEYRKATAKSAVDGNMINTQDKTVVDSNRDVHMGRASRVEEQLKDSKKKNSVVVNDNGKEEELALQSPSPSPSSYCAKCFPLTTSPNPTTAPQSSNHPFSSSSRSTKPLRPDGKPILQNSSYVLPNFEKVKKRKVEDDSTDEDADEAIPAFEWGGRFRTPSKKCYKTTHENGHEVTIID